MPDLPSSLALETVEDGSAIVASEHRNNYSGIQSAVNALIAALSGGTSGQVLTATDTDTVAWGAGDTSGKQLDEATVTADVTGIGSAADVDIVTGTAVTYDGTKVRVEVTIPALVATFGSPSYLIVKLFRGATEVGWLRVNSEGGTVVFYDTPTAASHTYVAKGRTDTGTVTAQAGAGGAALMPIRLRVTKA